MANVQTIDYANFTGGLNLRGDPFQIGDDQSPFMMNVEVDPVGGFYSRKGWEDWAAVAEVGTWNPRTLYSHVSGDGTEDLFLTNDGDLWTKAEGGAFTKDLTVVVGAAPHEAEFASWQDDVYIACGQGLPSYRWRANVFTAMTDASAAWANDYLAPSSDQMPQAEFTAVHGGYLWVANTNEGGTDYPHRIRFSHPNDPDSWAELDYFDIEEGGGPITGIVPFRDHLLVFFPHTVWAIYGYDLSSFRRVDVTKTVGAVNRQCIARSEQAVYFVSWPQGVHRITADSVDEVSVPLRPALKGSNFSSDTSLQWLSWADQRLYWTVPFSEDGAPTIPKSIFVLDPSIGAWTLHRSGCGCGVAPIVHSASVGEPLGTTRSGPTVLKLNATDAPTDTVETVEYDFDTYFRTRWMNAGMPTIKKRWKRPDLVVKEPDAPYSIEMHVFHDYDEANAKRTKTINVASGASGGAWFADPDWDGSDASLETPPALAPIWSETEDLEDWGWGEAAAGSAVEKAGSLGSAVSVQVEVHGEHGARWGVNAIVWKYVMRRVR